VLGLTDVGWALVVGGVRVDDGRVPSRPPDGRGGEGGGDQREQETGDELFLGEGHGFGNFKF
jgi:hypothetical protein